MPLTPIIDTDTDPQESYVAGLCGRSFVWDADGLNIFATGTRVKTRWISGADSSQIVGRYYSGYLSASVEPVVSMISLIAVGSSGEMAWR
ncbi:hypothetical protein [Nocardia carnea]|uniref:hypothetical protein n=1 Tax=Nocardia carnea TaxID=37328 RepID=UPI002458DFF3|nr:hypothetical protein [Nocardia carnea]